MKGVVPLTATLVSGSSADPPSISSDDAVSVTFVFATNTMALRTKNRTTTSDDVLTVS